MTPPTTRQAAKYAYGAVTPPIVRSSTFETDDAGTLANRFAGTATGPIYTRLGNPTVQALEAELASAEGGEACVATASGMGAIHVALMSLLKPGATLVVDHCVYGCTHSLLAKLQKWGVKVVATDLYDPVKVADALAGGVAVVFAETPMNPNLRLVDIRALADATHAAGGVLVIDNTFATPIVQQPLALGADLVVHSLTKGINGHSDLLAGAVIGSKSLVQGCWEWVKDAGAVIDPDTAWLVWRGMQTMRLRITAQCASAASLAATLWERGLHVRHPLLPDHPDHALARAQMPMGVGVVSLELGTQASAMAFLDRLHVFRRAVSLGGVESLVSHPASTTHAAIPGAERAKAGITEGLVRLSVGIEDYEMLLDDVTQALAGVPRPEMARVVPA